jgi:hypothetical protein
MIENHLWAESDPNHHISDSQHSVEELAASSASYHHLSTDSYHSHDYGHDGHNTDPNASIEPSCTHPLSSQPRFGAATDCWWCHGSGVEPGSNPTTVCSRCGGSGIGST